MRVVAVSASTFRPKTVNSNKYCNTNTNTKYNGMSNTVSPNFKANPAVSAGLFGTILGGAAAVMIGGPLAIIGGALIGAFGGASMACDDSPNDDLTTYKNTHEY